MRRRALIRFLAAISAHLPFSGARVWAQTAVFPGPQDKALKDLAAAVLPESLGRRGTDAVAAQFVEWVRQYRTGAELQTGYGFTRVRFQGPSPAPRYTEQLRELASGALAASDLRERRRILAGVLNAAKVEDLSAIPTGAHVVADLMSFYFASSAANDLAYGAAIGREKCRTLRNSGNAPAALQETSRAEN